MKNPKLRFNFKSYGDTGLLNKSGNVVLSFVDNPFFPDPVPPLAAAQEAVGIFSNALTAAGNRSRDNIAAKNQARKDLEGSLTLLAMYAMFVANGDVQALISTGFDVTKTPEPRYLVNPGNVTLTSGITSGEMHASVKNVAITGYVFGITDAPPTEDTVWTETPCSKSQYLFKNLVPGKQYWVRVAALGPRDQIAYSTIATMFVQ